MDQYISVILKRSSLQTPFSRLSFTVMTGIQNGIVAAFKSLNIDARVEHQDFVRDTDQHGVIIEVRDQLNGIQLQTVAEKLTAAVYESDLDFGVKVLLLINGEQISFTKVVKAS